MGNHFRLLRFCIVYTVLKGIENNQLYLKHYKDIGKRFRVYGAL